MATMYPTTIAELEKCQGVSKGKAMRYGKPFIDLIAKYVEENDIEKPDDFVMKSVVNKSINKVYIIQQVDKKIPLETIAKNKDLRLDALLEDMETIAASGTKLNLDYAIDEMLDEVRAGRDHGLLQKLRNDHLAGGAARTGRRQFQLGATEDHADQVFEYVRHVVVRLMLYFQ